ncbi:hypothetical protein BC940DRAFT_161389 [Gongronella butleri]|nr:hypothetical protein BC940DRAFT_161389 [Gongronella butleri]
MSNKTALVNFRFSTSQKIMLDVYLKVPKTSNKRRRERLMERQRFEKKGEKNGKSTTMGWSRGPHDVKKFAKSARFVKHNWPPWNDAFFRPFVVIGLLHGDDDAQSFEVAGRRPGCREPDAVIGPYGNDALLFRSLPAPPRVLFFLPSTHPFFARTLCK